MATKTTATKTIAPAPAPTKAPKKTSSAVAVQKTFNIVSIQAALKAQVDDIANRVSAPSGNKIRATQDKKFILPDGTTTPGPLELVVVEFAAVNNFYESDFKANEVTPPSCYAVGADPKKLVPAKNSPAKQADSCNDCPNNQFGSKGAGKACANGRLLVVLPPDADENTPLWLLQPSATAVKGFDGYVQSIVRMYQSMPVSMVTTVSFDPSETYAKMVFSDPQPNPLVNEHFMRQAEARDLLFAERDVSGYEPPAKPQARGGKGVRR